MMNNKRFSLLGLPATLIALALTETALIASPEEGPVLSSPVGVGPSRAAAYPAPPPDDDDDGRDETRIDGADFSVPMPAGFTGAALSSGNVVMTSRTARVDVKRIPALELADSARCEARMRAQGDAKHARMLLTEAWLADGEGGCRAWMSLPRRHVIEVLVNRGAQAYVVTCASKDADVVQSVCAPVIGGLRIEADARS